MTANSSDNVEVNVENQENLGEKVEPQEANAAGGQKETEDWKAKYYYLAAEFDNTRKRFEREKVNLLKYGNESLLEDLIEVVDNFDRTAEYLVSDQDPKVKNIVVGIDMVRKQFCDVMGKFGLKEIKAIGEVFDPNLHEAMAQQEVDGKKDMEVISVQQKGYDLNGRVLRASKVVVAREKTKN